MTTLNAAIIQFPVAMDVAANVAVLQAQMAQLAPGVLVVAPEGAMSGYLPEKGFVAALDQRTTERAIAQLRETAMVRRLHLIAGACIQEDGHWRNSAFYMGPTGQFERYDKVNLASSERDTFEAGDRLPVFDIAISSKETIRLGIQMCREIRYPEQWRVLAAKGAQVIAHLSNAVGSVGGHQVWRSHMISRAAEIQRFVVGANNAARDQTCPSMIVGPSGAVLAEAEIGVTGISLASLDMNEVSSWLLDQAREDVVSVREVEP